MAETAEYNRFVVPAEQAPDGNFEVICMDDRPPEESSVQSGQADVIQLQSMPLPRQRRLYHQLPGGIYALGFDGAIAMEMQKPGSYVDSANPQPVHVLASTFGKALLAQGYHGHLHQSCAAYGSAEEVGRTTITPERKQVSHNFMFERSQATLPTLDIETYEKGLEATERVLASGLIVPTHESNVIFPNQVPLVKEDHTGRKFLISNDAAEMFDVAAARKAGEPDYFINFGVLRDMHSRIHNLIPVEPEHLEAAMTMRLGALSVHLLGTASKPPMQHVYGLVA